jgi:hypothetical protein
MHSGEAFGNTLSCHLCVSLKPFFEEMARRSISGLKIFSCLPGLGKWPVEKTASYVGRLAN